LCNHQRFKCFEVIMGKSILILAVMVVSRSSFGQDKLSSKLINDRIENFLVTKGTYTPDTRKLKDSVDFYSFAIEINVTSKRSETLIDKISANDNIAFVL